MNDFPPPIALYQGPEDHPIHTGSGWSQARSGLVGILFRHAKAKEKAGEAPAREYALVFQLSSWKGDVFFQSVIALDTYSENHSYFIRRKGVSAR